MEAPWRLLFPLGKDFVTRKLHSGSPSPGEEESSWVFQTPSAQGLHQYLGALRLGWVLAGLSASGNLCSHAERSKEYRSERGSNAGTPSFLPESTIFQPWDPSLLRPQGRDANQAKGL